jgi:cysteinyl-tRNA synthetase
MSVLGSKNSWNEHLLREILSESPISDGLQRQPPHLAPRKPPADDAPMTPTRRDFLVATAALTTAARSLAAAPPPRRDYRAAMRTFVRTVAETARKQRPGFLVVPQGGLELLTADGQPGGPPAADYLAGIDGVGQEEVFYGYENKDGRKTPPRVTDGFLTRLAVAKAAGKPVLSIDYASKRPPVDDALARNAAAGLVPFVADRRGLDRVPKYPPRPVGQHAGDVTKLAEARNFLYLIDGGTFGTVQKYLAAAAATDFDLLVIDPLANDWAVSPDDLTPLRRKASGGRRLVLCYLSIGEAEDYRPYWRKEWKKTPPPFLGPENPDWKGNYAVRYWDPGWQSLIAGKDGLGRVVAAGFDGAYLDKVDEFDWWEEHGE